MDGEQRHIAILILAAGASKRMGQPKQLLPWKESTLLGNAIAQAKAVSNEVLVVLGAHLEQVEPIVGTVPYIENENWEQGMGTSIAKGIKHLADKTHIEAILIVLGDQPFLNAHYLQKLISTYRETDVGIVATQYGQKSGVPVVFNRNFFSALQALDADRGAHRLMQVHKNQLIAISPEGKALDIDTLETYNKLNKI